MLVKAWRQNEESTRKKLQMKEKKGEEECGLQRDGRGMSALILRASGQVQRKGMWRLKLYYIIIIIHIIYAVILNLECIVNMYFKFQFSQNPITSMFSRYFEIVNSTNSKLCIDK